VEQLGLLAAVDGDPVAISLLRRSLELHGELRDRWRMSSVLEDLAAIALAQGNAPHAARLLGAAEALREAIGTVIAPCERLQHNQTTAAVRTTLGDEAFDAALRQGQLASVDELIADLPSADPAGPPSDQTGPDQIRPDQGVPEQAKLDGAVPEQATPDPHEATPDPHEATPDPHEATPDPHKATPDTDEARADEAASGQPDQDRVVPAPARPAKQRAARPRAGLATGNGAAPGGMLRIRALGGAVVEVGDTALTAADWSYAKPRELMFLLASSPPMTKDQIAGALWPDLSRQQLGNALHTALRELRRALGDAGWVRYSDGQYRFDHSRPHECDVTAFEDALVAARRTRPAEAALPELQRAIAVYGGDFLDGMATGEWALVRRDELRRAFESALLATGRLQAAAGRHQAAAAAFRRAVAHEPLNESAHRELMNCWARLGETARAVRHYEELAGVLREQVGVAPAAETEALYRRLLAAQ
jgi:DNA-binding SARP family transcriptional activator